MFKNFFEARDALDRLITTDDEIDVTGSTAHSLAIFRYLLSHTFFKGDAYGWVREDRCGVKTLVKMTGYSLNTVKRALVELEKAGLIRRYARPRASGGRWPDEIYITWSYLHADDQVDEAEEPCEGPSSTQGPSESSQGPSGGSEEPTQGPSYIPQEVLKEPLEERGQARVSRPSSSSTGDEVTWDGDTSRLIIPKRVLGGTRPYYVSADGTVRSPLGGPRAGEVQVDLDLLDIRIAQRQALASVPA
jgi:DNA-binding MarR family transcriptional regulator